MEAIPYTTDYMNNAIFIRTSFIQTKHQTLGEQKGFKENTAKL